LRIQSELSDFNQRHLKEKFKEHEGEILIVEEETVNLKNQVKALEEKNQHLVDKINLLTKKKVISKID